MLRIAEFESIINAIKLSAEISDYQVKEYMVCILRWEQKLKVISDTKIKLDKDVIDLEEEPPTYVSTKRRFKSLNINFQGKVKGIQDADTSRSLYSLTKPVR